jgi:hypothetical protein
MRSKVMKKIEFTTCLSGKTSNISLFWQQTVKKIFFLGFFFIFQQALFAQDSQDYRYKQMYAYGINFNSQDGIIGGVSFRYAKAINERMFHNFSLEFVDIKHRQEQRTTSPITGEFFVPGKTNYLYAIRPQYGREFLMLKKGHERGAQMSLIAAFGPALGIVAPYMVQYTDNTGTIIRTTQYDPRKNISFGAILGTGSFSESLSSAQFQFGGCLKASMVLEFGVLKNNFLGMEIGGMLDVFSQKINMMAYSENKAIYTSVFVTFFGGFGK